MSQDELAVKILVDDSQFKDEIARLRRDLEDQYRIEIDKLKRPDRVQVDVQYAPQPTSTTVEVRGEVDDGLRKEVRLLREDITKLESKVGLPGQYSRLTLSDLNDLAQQAVTSPAWVEKVSKEFTDRFLDVAQELASRSYADIPMGELSTQSRYTSVGKAGLELYKMIRLSGQEGELGGAGLSTRMRRLESGAAMGSVTSMKDQFSERRTIESVAHRVLKSVSYNFFEAAGKTAYLETEFKQAGMRKRFDVYALFTGETPGGTTGPSMQFPEIKTGRTISADTVTQVADQIFVAISYLNDEYGITIDDIVKDPKILGAISGEASRIAGGIISLEKHSSLDIEQFQSSVMEMVIGRITTSSRASGDPEGTTLRKESQIRAAFQSKGITVPLRVISAKMRSVIRRAVDESEHMDNETQVEYVRDKVLTFLGTDEGAEDRATWEAWHNPTFNPQAQAELTDKIEAARTRIIRMVAEGVLDRPQAEADIRSVMQEGVDTGGAFGALDAARRTFGGGSMGGLPSIGVDSRGRQIRPTSRVRGRSARAADVEGRVLDDRFISGILDSLIGDEEDTRPEAVIREETLSGMSGGISEAAIRTAVERDVRAEDLFTICTNCGSKRSAGPEPCPTCKKGARHNITRPGDAASNARTYGALWALKRVKLGIFPIIPEWVNAQDLPEDAIQLMKRIENKELRRLMGESEVEGDRLLGEAANFSADLTRLYESGEYTEEEYDAAMDAFVTGEGSPTAIVYALLGERRRQLDLSRRGLITTKGIPMEIDPVEYRTGMEKVAKGMGFKKYEDFIELIEAKNAKDTTGFFQQRLGTMVQIMGEAFVREGEAGTRLFELLEEKAPNLMGIIGEAPSGVDGEAATAIQINNFLQGVVKEKITANNIGDLQKELNKLLNDESVRALLGAVNLPGAAAINIQMKQYEQANMDLEPAFGGALNYWT